MRDRTRILLERARLLSESPAATRRREDLIAEAVAAGHRHEFADRIYDLATETGLDPALAFAVVLSDLGVRELASSPPDKWQETQVEAPPAWVNPDPPQPDEASRERQLRLTFRRLQSLIEVSPSPEIALEAFTREPDVDDVGY